MAAAEATVWTLGAGIAAFVNVRQYVPRNVRHLRRLLKGTPVGMLTTQTRSCESHSRPMLVHDVDANGWLWLITDRHSRKACELSQLRSVGFHSSRSLTSSPVPSTDT